MVPRSPLDRGSAAEIKLHQPPERLSNEVPDCERPSHLNLKVFETFGFAGRLCY